ncbi:YehR family protein [Enterococcus gallinarum]|nr:YehR family protein [Enterococcus gallinarum]
MLLASCGANGASQKTKTFTNEQNGVQMELVFNYEGDEVKKANRQQYHALFFCWRIYERGSKTIIGSDRQTVSGNQGYRLFA